MAKETKLKKAVKKTTKKVVKKDDKKKPTVKKKIEKKVEVKVLKEDKKYYGPDRILVLKKEDVNINGHDLIKLTLGDQTTIIIEESVYKANSK